MSVNGDVPVEALKLPDVTLCAVSSVALPQTVRALTLSREQADFAETFLFTDDEGSVPASIDVRAIPCLQSIADYTAFMLTDLGRHIHTSHVLIVQWDGYVLDYRGWTPAFLDYDYVGAPWPQFSDGHEVGNGGFSLRSRRLLEACAEISDGRTPDKAEDVLICRDYRPLLESDYGLRFAPRSLAERFSFERTARRGDEFGFHGIFNMPEVMGDDAFRAFYTGLPDGLLSRRSRAEIVRILQRRSASGWRPLLAKLGSLLR